MAPATEDKPTMSKEQQAEVLAAAGVLTRPDGSRYETETGFQIAQHVVPGRCMSVPCRCHVGAMSCQVSDLVYDHTWR